MTSQRRGPARSHAPRAARRRTVRTTLVALAAVALLGGCAVSPHAVPSAGGYAPNLPPVEGTEVTIREDFSSTPEETHEFWSDPTMFEGGTGVQYAPPENGISGGQGDPATGAYVAPTTPTPATESENAYGDIPNGQLYGREGLGASTFGRLYLEYDSGIGLCSATVVSSKNRSVVATAAHCLTNWDESGNITHPKSAMFVPADRNDAKEAPYDKWAAKSWLMPQNFLDNAKLNPDGTVTGSGWTTDFAFLIMEEKHGKRIQDVTGGQGIAFGVPVQKLTQIGYPSAAPYDGKDEYFCASTSWKQGWASGYDHKCDMTPGSSGGAWLAYYDKAIGAGYVVAVNSTGDRVNAEGSILGQGALALYQQAESA